MVDQKRNDIVETSAEDTEPVSNNGQSSSVMEKIVGRRLKNDQIEYLVKWRGRPAEENTWELEKAIEDPLILVSFENELRRRPNELPRNKKCTKKNQDDILLWSLSSSEDEDERKEKEEAENRQVDEKDDKEQDEEENEEGEELEEEKDEEEHDEEENKEEEEGEEENKEDEEGEEENKEDEEGEKENKENEEGEERKEVEGGELEEVEEVEQVVEVEEVEGEEEEGDEEEIEEGDKDDDENDNEKTGFERGLKPVKILGATDRDGELMFLMEWEGTTDKDLVKAAQANVLCPSLVIEFYEQRLVWY
ncbi:unnamed protein product [Spodoptera exigua]|nr:unnamed protein product [Spodoptera exigua]